MSFQGANAKISYGPLSPVAKCPGPRVPGAKSVKVVARSAVKRIFCIDEWP